MSTLVARHDTLTSANPVMATPHVLDSNGDILASVRRTQQQSASGGTIPWEAGERHRAALPDVTAEALAAAGLGIQDITAIACTVRWLPNLSASSTHRIHYTHSRAGHRCAPHRAAPPSARARDTHALLFSRL